MNINVRTMKVLLVGLVLSVSWYRSNGCDVATTCVTDMTAADCEEGELFYQNAAVFGCCPACERRAGQGQSCANMQCLPGLMCLPQLNICMPDNNVVIPPEPDPEDNSGACEPPQSGSYPACLPDGNYAPVQCKGDEFTGRCFCTNASGRRIFGQMWRTEAQDMTCACSRRRADLESSGRADVTLHCTPSGNYEPLQCDAGLCWCAEPRTGQPLSLPLSEANMHSLPCYSASVTGSQYLRRCESLVYALNLIRREQSEHGTNFFGTPFNQCNYDGSYGAYQITNGQAYCTGRDGDILGAWQATQGAATTAGMNCNCALDTMVHFPANGMSVSQVCLANGNYQEYQVSGDFHYCVDNDGYPTTGYEPLETDIHCQPAW